MSMFGKLKAVGTAGLGMATLPLLSGCDSRDAYSNQTLRQYEAEGNASRDSSKADRLAAIKDIGNGVYIFPASLFPETLSDFKEKNPNLRVTAISTSDDSKYGAQNFVVDTEPK